MGDHLFDVGGAHVARLEDVRLVTGGGTYASDWNLAGQLHAHFIRSDRAHAKIVSIDASEALKQPGVAGVYTGEDAVRAGFVKALTLLNFPGKGGMQVRVPERPALAHGRVRFVGEPVAVVVASTALGAQDAAERVSIEYEDLPAVVDPEDALKSGAPQLHGVAPGNYPFEYEAGDKAATEAAFAKAAHVTRLTLVSNRVVPSPMEPRGGLAVYDPKNDAYTVHVPVQGVNMMKRQIAAYTQLKEDQFTVMARDVGGGFGQRSTCYPEYCALLIAAKATGKPVKWVGSRTEGFLSDTHGRGNVIDGELALDKDGRFLAIRLNWLADMGAYLAPAGPVSHLRNPTICIVGVYTIPVAYGDWRLAFTNTAPISAYRGAGRPDIAYVVERLVSTAAKEMGIDQAEIRRRNFIPPEAFPYKTPTGSVYDNADLPGMLAKALDLADWSGYEKRRKDSERRGRLRGRGISTVIEGTGAGMYPRDEIELEVDAKGDVTAYTVAHSQGQGHETSFAMMVAKAMQIPVERVKIRQGIPGRTIIGNHSGGSRSMVGAGTVCYIAGEKLVQHATSLAAEELGLEPSQVSYAGGEFKGSSGASITLAQLAAKRPVTAKGEGTFAATFPNGCHIAEVEIDPDTGVTEIVKYSAVDDCGVVVNHAIVEGQVHGALAQGAGQVFGEQVVYDRDTGQLLTATFSDYYMPRSDLLPDVAMAEHPTSSRVNPLGIKGMGESGCTASLPALVNAVVDALEPLGIGHLDMPLTPSRVWAAIGAARSKQ